LIYVALKHAQYESHMYAIMQAERSDVARIFNRAMLRVGGVAEWSAAFVA